MWIGAAATLIVGLSMAIGDAEFFRGTTALEIGANIFFIALAGMMFGVLSQMFFFAYMTLNYIARDMFRRPTTWLLVQLFFIMTVPFEIYFFMWSGGLVEFIVGLSVILAASVGVAYWKVRLTRSTAFLPTLFFMFVFTMLETAIALKVDDTFATLFMAVPLLACNAWQILRLHKLVQKEES